MIIFHFLHTFIFPRVSKCRFVSLLGQFHLLPPSARGHPGTLPVDHPVHPFTSVGPACPHVFCNFLEKYTSVGKADMGTHAEKRRKG